MDANFIVVLDSGGVEQRDAISLYLQAQGFHFWHWVDNVWLISDAPVGLSPSQLWERLAALPSLGGQKMLVLGLNSSRSFFGNLDQRAWPWLQKFWGIPK